MFKEIILCFITLCLEYFHLRKKESLISFKKCCFFYLNWIESVAIEKNINKWNDRQLLEPSFKVCFQAVVIFPSFASLQYDPDEGVISSQTYHTIIFNYLVTSRLAYLPIHVRTTFQNLRRDRPSFSLSFYFHLPTFSNSSRLKLSFAKSREDTWQTCADWGFLERGIPSLGFVKKSRNHPPVFVQTFFLSFKKFFSFLTNLVTNFR